MKIDSIIKERDVILFGGSPEAFGPKLDNPVVVRVNNHHLWQEREDRVADGYNWTDISYFGASLSGLLAMFMNMKPNKLKLVCQDLGDTPRGSMAVWASMRKIGYRPYRSHADYPPLNKIVKRPFSGVFAAWDILEHNPRSLHITGMDFYKKTDTVKDGYRGEHEISGNIEAMRRIIEDERVHTERVLRESL